MPRRFNCCLYNHPCPIYCPFVDLSNCTNEVVNPVINGEYAFFNNLNAGTIASQAIIPLNFVQSNGFTILPNGTGGIILPAGNYQVSYFANGIIPASGTLSLKLRLNGTDLPGSVLNSTQTAGDNVTLTQSMVFTASQNSTLELVNNSAVSTTYSLASVVINRI